MVAKKLYYTMGEVAEMFDVKASLIRHWESKFSCIRPRKNKKGNRLFTPEDIERLKQIYHLVKERGMTLDGANKVMRSSAKMTDVSRDTEMLERLQRIRAALVEVREELKLGVGEHIVEVDDDEELDVEQLIANQVDDDQLQEPSKEAAAASVEVAEDVQADEETSDDVATESATETSAEKPRKRVVRRKKKDDDNKELFPFYEQSLF
ncbi:MAG: MerR family transcriptional regulator [Rikenellaceae bacterium]|nr:MerR family transcriptional regulator [Rikenellaceae bacterium]